MTMYIVNIITINGDIEETFFFDTKREAVAFFVSANLQGEYVQVVEVVED